ncbi:MAG TPA: molybdopterin dinucleotide binding domain-containing protein [Gemmatimonadaceae bacterium]|nr:molybdopterin dinucleotide binding domain-containing protein [Gemmatimonadaceae bacterium]
MAELKGFNPPLQVERLIATRRGDPERGPAVWMNPREASVRMLLEGELAWVYGPRRHELATVHIDDSLRRGIVVLRDIAGASPSEIVRVIKPDLDRPESRSDSYA